MRIPRLRWSSALTSALCGVIGTGSIAPTPVTAHPEKPEAAFFARYWTLPIPLQGSPPPTFHPLAASLHPRSCAVCHPRQFADWQTSLHAHAMGPGITGQLVDMRHRRPRMAESCENCHAPLGEQHEHRLDARDLLRPNAAFDPALQPAGVSCAACHVRDFHRNGPPRDPARPSGITWQGSPAKPHGDVRRTPFFERSQFCAACHQFGAGNDVNGKPLENTIQEWKRSMYARDGISCQQCHMPERRHLWRGIHDPEMVERGVSIDFAASANPGFEHRGAIATLTVKNVGVGHDFPTYVTPQVVVRIEQQDAGKRSLPRTRSEWRIARSIDFTDQGPKERSDTRIPPGASSTFAYRKARSPRASFLHAWIQVYPDHYYTGFYHQVLAQADRSSLGKAQLVQALRHSQATSYRIFERVLALGPR